MDALGLLVKGTVTMGMECDRSWSSGGQLTIQFPKNYTCSWMGFLPCRILDSGTDDTQDTACITHEPQHGNSLS
jgi:hypothetical protein